MTLWMSLAWTAATWSADDFSPHLLIRDPEVLNDVRASGEGPWSFLGTVHKLFSKTVSPSPGEIEPGLVDWFSQWSATVDSNGHTLEPRNALAVIREVWPKAPNGALIRDQSPYRLIAILFRLDLRNPDSPAGEGRFVFQLSEPFTEIPIESYVIFEFALASPGETVKFWAQRIQDLSQTTDLNSYKVKLEAMTESFAVAEKLRFVRTNDFVFAPIWELRNFTYDSIARRLVATPIPGTPHSDFDTTKRSELEVWIISQSLTSRDTTLVLPSTMQTTVAPLPSEFYTWLEGSRVPTPARRIFAQQTCNGCHGIETETRFTHFFKDSFQEVTKTSDFLARELEKRNADLIALLSGNAPAYLADQRVH